MKNDKYEVIPHMNITSRMGTAVTDHSDNQQLICICTGPNQITNAERIKNLLNETSRSQGKWPKN